MIDFLFSKMLAYIFYGLGSIYFLIGTIIVFVQNWPK